MKILGLRSLERRATVTLIGSDGEKVSIVVSALPFGFEVETARDIPPPAAPVLRTGIGRDGRPWTEFDRDGADYKAKEADVTSLQLVAMIHAALRNETKIEWTAKRTDFAAAIDFYRAIRDEMKAIGFTLLDWNAITDALATLSGQLGEAMKEARKDFLPVTPAAS